MTTIDGYQIFAMIQLAQAKGVLEKENEYDIIWEKGKELYKKFLNSKFNSLGDSEYDCMNTFLDTENYQTFQLDVDVIEVNRYKYSVEAKSLENAKEMIVKHLEGNCPTSLDSHMKNGIQGYDRECGFETLSVRDVTEQ